MKINNAFFSGVMIGLIISIMIFGFVLLGDKSEGSKRFQIPNGYAQIPKTMYAIDPDGDTLKITVSFQTLYKSERQKILRKLSN